MKKNREQNLDKMQLSLYLMPIFGPIYVLMSFGNIDSSHTKMAMLSLRLGIGWMITYSGLWLGSNLSSDILSFRLLFFNGLLTTGYFLTCLFFIILIWNRRD